MGNLLLSLSCFKSWSSHSNGPSLLRGTLRQLSSRVDGFVVPLEYSELEDLLLGRGNSASPARLRGYPPEVAEEVWKKPTTCIALPLITDLVEGAEVALADVMNEIGEKLGIFRFYLPVTSIEAVELLTSLTENLSPYVSIIVSEMVADPEVQTELSLLLMSEPPLSYAVHGRYWTEDLPLGTNDSIDSFIKQHPLQYTSLRWSAANSLHRSYRNRAMLGSCLVSGSGFQIPSRLVEGLQADGSIIIEGYTPMEATPLLAQEIAYVRKLCDSLTSLKTAQEIVKVPTRSMRQPTSHQLERPPPSLT